MDGSDRSMDRNETRYTRQARRELANAQVCLTNAGLYFHLREDEVWPQALGVGIVNHLISGTRLTACQPVWQRIELGGDVAWTSQSAFQTICRAKLPVNEQEREHDKLAVEILLECSKPNQGIKYCLPATYRLARCWVKPATTAPMIMTASYEKQYPYELHRPTRR